MNNIFNPRLLAINALCRIDEDGAYSNLTVSSVLKETGISKTDKAFCTSLIYGTLDRKITIDYFLKKFIQKGFNKLKPFTLNTLRTAVYQIKFMDKIPDSAAVNESVNIIKKSKEAHNTNFVNGVLRNIARTEIQLPSGNSVFDLSVRFSCPSWIVEGLINDYSLETAIVFLEHSLLPPKTFIRVNRKKITADELKAKLYESGIKVQDADCKDALIISEYSAIEEYEYFKKGCFFVQDIACQKAVGLLEIGENDSILDMCSAPGGKAFCAKLSADNVSVTACDIYEQRVNLIKSSAERLGFDDFNTSVCDAVKFNKELGSFNKIICDVPCSGIGVISRKPDIKYKKQSDFRELESIQTAILCNADNYLMSGGSILYSTCTLRKAENEDIINKFLESHKNYTLKKIKTFMPHTDNSDGFFAAVLIKN